MRPVLLGLSLLGTLALAGLPAPGGAQAVGSEFQVNTYTTGAQNTGGSNQFHSSGRVIAADASGHFVIVWQSQGQDGSGFGIFGQRYDSAGEPKGNEFRVNTTTTNSQSSPAVASDPEGNFVVVWESADGSDQGIFGQRYDSGGGAQGTEFRVNSFTFRHQEQPAVAKNVDGTFVVAWESLHTGSYEIFARRYDSAGNALGMEFRVNSYTTGYQIAPAVASDPGGNFVVVWYSYDYPPGNGKYGVFGQRYDDAGSPLGAEFEVDNSGSLPGISFDASGNFVVVWQNLDIWGRRYDSAGLPLGPQFRVNTYADPDRYQRHPKVASDEDGNFVVVWQSLGQDGQAQYEGVFGRHFDAPGVAQGSDFRVNSHTPSDQNGTSVAATGANEFVAVWTSFGGQDGSKNGVFGQRFDFSGGSSTLHVGDLDRRAKNVGATTWRAQVKTLAHDDGHLPESGVLVMFNVSGGVGMRNCTTLASGVCEVSVVVSDSVPSLTFTVTSLSKVGVSYDAGVNHDPDGDSNGTVIVVKQP